MPADFENQDYWRKRFASETCFEWLTSSAAFMNVLAPYLQHVDRSSRILHLGSGTSNLHNHLRERGFTDITNIDYEPLALERGQQLERGRFGDVQTKYLAADATRLELEDKCRAVIDKSTVDAIACGEDGAVLSIAEEGSPLLGRRWVLGLLSFSSDRFAGVEHLFGVEIIQKLPTLKTKPTDPDVFHYCYLLRPRVSA